MGVLSLDYLAFLLFASSVVLKDNLANASSKHDGYAIAWGTWMYQMCDFVDRALGLGYS